MGLDQAGDLMTETSGFFSFRLFELRAANKLPREGLSHWELGFNAVNARQKNKNKMYLNQFNKT